MRTRKWKSTGYWIILGLVAFCTACGTMPATVKGSLTPVGASAIVQSFDTANAKANNTLNTMLQNNNEEGTAAAIDDAYFAMFRLEGDKSEPPGVTAKPTWSVKAYVEPMTTYPMYFAATIVTTSKPAEMPQLFVFERDTKSSPWRVIYEVPLGTSPSKNVPVLAAQEGNVALHLVAAAPVLTQFARYRQDYTSSTPNKSFVAGAFTTTWNEQLQQQFSGVGKSGTGTITSVVDPQAQCFQLQLPNGNKLVFGTLKTVTTITAKPTYAFTQPSNRSVLPGLLAPGAYSKVVVTSLDQVVIEISKNGARNTVLGDYEGAIAATGTLSTSGGNSQNVPGTLTTL